MLHLVQKHLGLLYRDLVDGTVYLHKLPYGGTTGFSKINTEFIYVQTDMHPHHIDAHLLCIVSNKRAELDVAGVCNFNTFPDQPVNFTQRFPSKIPPAYDSAE